MASGRSHQDVTAGINAIVQDRESVLTIHAAPSHSKVPPTKLLSFRQTVTTGSRPSPPILAQAAESDPHAKEQATKQRKVDGLFHVLLEHVLDLQELGISLEQAQDPAVIQQLKETVMARPSQLSALRLGALTSSFQRWRKFATSKGYPVRAPLPLQLAEFFQQASRGGPTAASALWQSLRWFEDKMNMPLGLHHFLVAPFQYLPADYSAKVAPELEPWEFCNLLLLARQLTGTNLLVVCFVIQAAVACVRFEHVQRSSWTAAHGTWLEFWCKQGKKRIRGARPGYSWCMPEVAFQGFSLVKILHDFVRHEALPNQDFQWPAVQLQADDMFDVTEATPVVLDRQMSRNRFLELFRGALIQRGLKQLWWRATTGFGALCRHLPTALV